MVMGDIKEEDARDNGEGGKTWPIMGGWNHVVMGDNGQSGNTW